MHEQKNIDTGNTESKSTEHKGFQTGETGLYPTKNSQWRSCLVQNHLLIPFCHTVTQGHKTQNGIKSRQTR